MRWLRAAVTWSVAASLVLVGPGVRPVALAQAASGGATEALETLERYDRALDGLRSAIGDRVWTADDLGMELAFEDAETIRRHVREGIAFEPYVGVLRGADGTIQSGAGNAWDQSLLLAGLLVDAGYEARIVRARIGPAEAAELVGGVLVPRRNDGTPDAEATRRFLDEAGASFDDFEALASVARGELEAASARVEAHAEGLAATLEAAGVPLDGEPSGAWNEEARDYVWVQYSLTGADPWSDAHPAAPAGAAWVEDLVPEEQFEGTIPEELQHRLRFRAVVERRLGSDLEAQPVTEAWERPIANLNGMALSYASAPNGFQTDDPAGTTLEEAYENTSFLLPMFGEAVAPGAQMFDVTGAVVPPEAAAHPAGGLFQSLGEALGGAVDEVSGEEESVALTAHWLEFTLIAPGGEETTHRRMVVDRLGDERRRSGEVGGPLTEMTDAELIAALAQTHTFMVAPGSYPKAYVDARTIDGLDAALPYLRETLSAAANDSVRPPRPDAEVAETLRALPLLGMFAALDEPPVVEAISYRPEPTLAVVSRSWDGAVGMVDLVHNARRSFVPGDSGPVPAPATSLQRGVWESYAEGFALATPDGARDTLSFFDAVRTQGVPVRVLQTEVGEELDALSLPPRSLDAIRRDLSAGYAVVAPERLPTEQPTAFWWRVDPVTGETLGRGGDGRGLMEDVAVRDLIAGFVISAFMGSAGFGMCMGSGGDLACCYLDFAAGFVGGFVLALVIGWATGLAALGYGVAVGLGVDLVAVGGGMAGFPPSFCSAYSRGRNDPADRRAAGGGCFAPGWSYRTDVTPSPVAPSLTVRPQGRG